MNRRTLLSSLPAALVWGGGCLGRDEPQARLAWVDLRNDTDRAHDATVTVLDGEETVFEERVRLGTGPQSSKRVFDRPVTGEGDYVVRATIGDERRELIASDHVDGDETCVGVRFLVTDGGSFVIDHVRAMQQC
ncbi:MULTISPECIES: hypothetical protein [Salinibaculum]|uniref:hypothetical protein n=1 Tax=Salinibaculum TaxID=2732368 RepID=UPI0030CD62F7